MQKSCSIKFLCQETITVNNCQFGHKLSFRVFVGKLVLIMTGMILDEMNGPQQTTIPIFPLSIPPIHTFQFSAHSQSRPQGGTGCIHNRVRCPTRYGTRKDNMQFLVWPVYRTFDRQRKKEIFYHRTVVFIDLLGKAEFIWRPDPSLIEKLPWDQGNKDLALFPSKSAYRQKTLSRSRLPFVWRFKN